MGEISIKINIADRVYPLKVNMEEEELIRRAAKLINDRIKEYQDNYAVRDKQDLLSMCVLHYATATLKAEKKVMHVLVTGATGATGRLLWIFLTYIAAL